MDEEHLDAEVEQAEEVQSQEPVETTTDEHLDNNEGSEQEEAEHQESPDEDSGSLSPRQQKRVDQIEEKAKEAKFNKILDRIENAKYNKDVEAEKKALLDYKKTLDADENVYEQLENDRREASEQGYSRGLQQAQSLEWKTNLRMDLPLVKEKLDKLDPVDAEAIDKEYLFYSGFDPNTGTVRNPNISYAEFVEARVEQATRLAERLAVQSQRNIAQQAANTGVRPTGGTANRGVNITSAEDIAKMTPEEWEKHRDAVLKQVGISKYDSPYQ